MKKHKLGLIGLALLALEGCSLLIYDGKIGDSEVILYRNYRWFDKTKMIVKKGDSVWTYDDDFQDGTVDLITKNEGKKLFEYCNKDAPEQKEIFAKATENYNLLLEKIGQNVSAEMNL